MSNDVKIRPVTLLVEDNADHAEALVLRLKRWVEAIVASAGKYITYLDNGKIEVTEWEQSEEGEKTGKKWTGIPDYYIFDLRMPGETGIEIWKRLNKPEKYVFLTIWEDDDYWRDKMKIAGIDLRRIVSKRGRDIKEIIDKIKTIMIADDFPLHSGS